MMQLAPVLCLSLALLQPLAAPEPRPLRIDASEVPEVEDVRAEIERAVMSVLDEHGIAPDEVRIKIIWLDANDLVVGIYASVDPDVDPLDTLVVKCPEVAGAFCTPKKMPAYVRRAVQRAVERRQGRHEPPAPLDSGVEQEAPPTTSVTQESDDPPAQVEPLPPERRWGAMRIAGMSLVGAGVASLAIGTAFAVVQQTRPNRMDQSRILPLETAGYALLGAGGALLTTGVVLWIVDRTRAKRAVAIVPQVQPGRAFFALEGRF